MKQIVALSIAVTIALIGALSLPAFVTFHGELDKGVFDGKVAQKLEAHYNDELPVKSIALNTWTAANYLAFNEGRPGVVVGDEGWLYTREEFDVYEDMDARYNRRLKQIATIKQILSDNNVELVFVLLPAKARIYPQHFDHYPSELDQAYHNIYSAIVKSGIHSPNIYRAFAKNADKKLFLRTDTHWTPLGALLCANEIGDYIDRHIAENIALDQTKQFAVRQKTSRLHEGDLFSYLPLGVYQDFLGPEKEMIDIFETELVESNTEMNNALFGDLGTEVALVGSSYSANPLWSFEGYLKQALHADVVNFAEEGQGPVKPMVEYLSSDDFKNNPPKLVIWEFPERYFPVEYQEVAQFFNTNESVDISYISPF
ncbi:putative alginate O-acetylase AlgJ [Thalassocella blandensis]|nr:putative alginate O-acetylase AlgJ [Thalassocella blandensis]